MLRDVAPALGGELDQPVPRQVKMSRRYKLFVAFPNVFFIGMIVFNIILTLHQSLDKNILKYRGMPSNGNITKKYTVYSKFGEHDIVYYRFTVKNPPNSQSILSSWGFVSRAQFNELKIGEIVPIVYDPLQTDRSMLDFGSSVQLFYPFQEVIRRNEDTLAIFGGADIALTFAFLNVYFREKKLLRWGRAAQAVIINEEEYRAKGRDLSTVTYHFTDTDGKSIQGKRTAVPAKSDPSSKSVEFRTRVIRNPTALFDPSNSAKSSLYPLKSVELG